MYNLDINPVSDGLKRFSPFLLLFTLLSSFVVGSKVTKNTLQEAGILLF
jgi:hypothetical protein